MAGLLYYEKTVRYPLVVRMNIRDSIGKLLTETDPFVAVREDEIRDFKVANRKAIQDGTIRTAEEPTLDWETPNTFSDDEIDDLLKGYLKLKQKVSAVTSVPILEKFMRRAKETNKSEKVIGLIQERLDELQGTFEDRSDMRGVE